jgi:hypothetical protein
VESLQTGLSPREGYCINMDMVRIDDNTRKSQQKGCCEKVAPIKIESEKQIILRE